MWRPSSDDVVSVTGLIEHDDYDRVVAPLTGAAFWAAIALPFLHVPLLIAGLESRVTTAAFVGLLAANVIALLVGHPYQRD